MPTNPTIPAAVSGDQRQRALGACRLDHPTDGTGSTPDAEAMAVLARAGSRRCQQSQPSGIDEAHSREIDDYRRRLVLLERLPQRILEERSGGEIELSRCPDHQSIFLPVDADDKRVLANRTQVRHYPVASLPPPVDNHRHANPRVARSGGAE
jgi:hypothetical protein